MKRFLTILASLALGWTARGWQYHAPVRVAGEPIHQLLGKR